MDAMEAHKQFERWEKKMLLKVEVAKKRRAALDPNAPDYDIQKARLLRRVQFLRHITIIACFRLPTFDGSPRQFHIHITPR